MIFPKEFYPTPLSLAHKMLDSIDMNYISTILEPSAGKGDLIEAFKSKTQYRGNRLDFDAIELDENLRQILTGKEIRVVHDDFLTFETYKKYGLILMNPPFSNGVSHLLKALDMQKRGGQIICLLNAETLRNAYTAQRKDLVRKLDEYNAEIEYIDGTFQDAERPTGVEIALINVKIPQAASQSIILEGLKKQENGEQTHSPNSGKQITFAAFLSQIVAQYKFEAQAGIRLLSEYEAMEPLLACNIKDDVYSKPIIKIKICGEKGYEEECKPNMFIKMVRHKYWTALFVSDMFRQMLTSKLQYEYLNKIKELQEYDFSAYNIAQITANIKRDVSKSIEDTILDLFDEFSSRHTWAEYSKNIHYYNGWKTNKAWMINKKIVIPLNGFNNWNKNSLDFCYTVKSKLMDIEKVLNYLDDGGAEYIDLGRMLENARNNGQSRKIKLKYFDVTFYKKGTCHIEFTHPELLKKFNIFGSQRKGWLPPGYGKKDYANMDTEEKAVVDDFEGREEYEKILKNSGYYLVESINVPLIA